MFGLTYSYQLTNLKLFNRRFFIKDGLKIIVVLEQGWQHTARVNSSKRRFIEKIKK